MWRFAVLVGATLVGANECPNEPPLVGAHYMSNWHSGRWSQWRRCHDGANLFEVYPERAPTTGLYHDVNGYYSFDGRPPQYRPCTEIFGIPTCTQDFANAPCCDTHDCMHEPNGHMKCPGGAEAFPAEAFTTRLFAEVMATTDRVSFPTVMVYPGFSSVVNSVGVLPQSSCREVL